VTHDELQNDLAAHLRGAGDRMVWTNTQLGPSGSPRPDVFTVNKSFARFRADCYEIKVSTSDLRHDVTSGKWQSYRKFGHAVWFAFPRGMVPMELIPKECGIILRGETWRASRKPVPQVLDTLPRDAWLKLLMADMQDTEPQPRSMCQWKAEEIIRQKWGAEIGELFRDRRSSEYRYEKATERLKASAAAIEEEVKRSRESALQIAKGREERLNEALIELGHQLGLKAGDVTAQTLTTSLRALQRKLNGNGLKDAINMLQTLQGAIDEPAALPVEEALL
jgi:hypothetical protein